MIFLETCCLCYSSKTLNHLLPPPLLDGVQRVSSFLVLGVTLEDDLRHRRRLSVKGTGARFPFPRSRDSMISSPILPCLPSHRVHPFFSPFKMPTYIRLGNSASSLLNHKHNNHKYYNNNKTFL